MDVAVSLVSEQGGRRTHRGTAYQVSPGHFLTMGYVLGSRSALARRQVAPVLVKDSNGLSGQPCEILWKPGGNQPDQPILLRLRDADRAPSNEVTAWGRLRGTGAHYCALLSFPRFAQRELSLDDETLALERTPGAILLPTSDYAGNPVFRVLDDFVFEEGAHGSWHGAGGAPVFAQDVFVGILSNVQSTTRLMIFPATRIYAEKSLVNQLERDVGGRIELVDIEADEGATQSADSAISEVARTDPKNIQEVAAAQFQLSNAYYENVLSQARRSFAAAVIAAVVGTGFFLTAVALAIQSGSSDATTVSALSGAVVQVIAGLNFWLYSRTAAQLNAFHVRLERMQKYLLANSVCANLSPENRDAAMGELVRTISQDVESLPAIQE